MKSSRAYMMLIVAALMWSLGGLFIKLVDLHPISISGVRSLGAALLLLFFIYVFSCHDMNYSPNRCKKLVVFEPKM